MAMKKAIPAEEPVSVYDGWSHCYLRQVAPLEWETPPGFSEKFHSLLAQEAGLQNMLNGVAKFVAEQRAEIERQKTAAWVSLRKATGTPKAINMALEDDCTKLVIHAASPEKTARLIVSEPPEK